MAEKDRQPDSVVKTGGIAREDSDIEDVTRDTYGHAEADRGPEGARSDEERKADANRAAAVLGLSGADVGEESRAEESGAGVDDEVAGRTADQGDAEGRSGERSGTRGREREPW